MAPQKRTLEQLLAARAAGEPLRSSEKKRLGELDRRFGLIQEALHRDGVEYAWWNHIEAGADPFDLMWGSFQRIETLRNVRELRAVSRWYLSLGWMLLGRDVGDLVSHRQQQQQHSQAGLNSVGARRTKADAEQEAIETIKQRSPHLSYSDAAQNYLRNGNEDLAAAWHRMTDEQQKRAVGNLVRRTSRARSRTKKAR